MLQASKKQDTDSKFFTLNDAAQMAGFELSQLIPAAQSIIESQSLQYRVTKPQERKSVLSDVIRALARRKFEPAGESRKSVWERGWSENLEAFIETDFNTTALRPYYMHRERPFRLNGDYVISETPDVEYLLSRFMRMQLFGTYFKAVDSIYEFGAGTGANILNLNVLFPDKKICGLDWTEASAKIMKYLHEKLNPNISGRVFDFFNPDYTLNLPPDCGVLTSGALEQIGDRFEPFLGYLLEQRPKIVVHMEPILEYYDEEDFFDVLASEYHRQRNYLYGYIPRLHELKKAGKIKIFKEHRTKFGSIYDDCYSYIIWEPT